MGNKLYVQLTKNKTRVTNEFHNYEKDYHDNKVQNVLCGTMDLFTSNATRTIWLSNGFVALMLVTKNSPRRKKLAHTLRYSMEPNSLYAQPSVLESSNLISCIFTYLHSLQMRSGKILTCSLLMWRERCSCRMNNLLQCSQRIFLCACSLCINSASLLLNELLQYTQ